MYVSISYALNLCVYMSHKRLTYTYQSFNLTALIDAYLSFSRQDKNYTCFESSIVIIYFWNLLVRFGFLAIFHQKWVLKSLNLLEKSRTYSYLKNISIFNFDTSVKSNKYPVFLQISCIEYYLLHALIFSRKLSFKHVFRVCLQ